MKDYACVSIKAPGSHAANGSITSIGGLGIQIQVNMSSRGRPTAQHRPNRKADGSLYLPDLTGRTVLVTGAGSGIGRAAALQLAAAGATVLVHGRSPERLAEVARTVGTDPLQADFAKLSDVRRLADGVRARTECLHAILHNAGAFHRSHALTEDGHERTFQTNYLASFLLQMLLNDLLLRASHSRVVVTSSVAARLGTVNLEDLELTTRPYRPFFSYATTKLLGILFVRELRRRLSGAGVRAVAVHPGPVGTNFGSGSLFPDFMYRIPIRKKLLIGYFVCTAAEGAEPLVWSAAAPDRESVDGLYFSRFTPRRPPSPLADDPDLAQRLWMQTERMLQPWIGPTAPVAGTGT